MVWTVMAVCWRRLRHNRTEVLLAFVVPIAFFSIFAVIFGSATGIGSKLQVKVVAVDTVGSESSRQLIDALRHTAGLRFVDDALAGPEGAAAESAPRRQQQAEAMVRRGTIAMAIVIRRSGDDLQADLLNDASDPVAPQVVAALVQQAMIAGASQRRPAPSPAAPQGQVTEASLRRPAASVATVPAAVGSAAVPAARVRLVDVLGDNKGNPVVTMYAAGIAVMFLLFGATAGGGALLEERENRTLDRLLTSGLTMDQLLLGKWIYLTLLGVAQTTLMFVWGQAVFGVDLLGHFDGFLIMTLVTAGAAAAFGLLLATLCRSRGQLNGLSVIVVLSMSALGGSMVPRYVMSPGLRDAGLWTFNAWALDGYDKVFWREMPAGELWPQMSMLMLCGAVFLVTARVLAIRWETQ